MLPLYAQYYNKDDVKIKYEQNSGTNVFTTFWRLWSITEQTHSNIEPTFSAVFKMFAMQQQWTIAVLR